MKIKDSFIKALFGVGFVSIMIASFMDNALAFLTETKLTASDAARDDLFGQSVSIHGDTALVGAPHEYDGARIQAQRMCTVIMASSG